MNTKQSIRCLFRLTHSERDIASKRVLIENYKTRLNEMETNLSRSNDRDTTQVKLTFLS